MNNISRVDEMGNIVVQGVDRKRVFTYNVWLVRKRGEKRLTKRTLE